MFCLNLSRAVLISLMVFITFSCSTDEYRDYLYDLPGFDPGTRPRKFSDQRFEGRGLRFEEFYNNGQDIDEAALSNKVRSDQYRQQYIDRSTARSRSMYNPKSQIPRNTANSRFYNNPYENPNPDFYPSGDIERYYVPPPYYQNIERSYAVPAAPETKFRSY